MKNLRILIADDEQPARQKAKKFLAQEEHIAAISEAENGPEAVQIISGQNIDLVFLDIQMPGMNGFEVIEKIGAENMPPVIFVTAYDQYAIHAFKVQAVDYLLKPFGQNSFHQSFQRALQQIRSKPKYSELFSRLLQEVKQKKEYIERIMVNSGSRYFFIPVDDVLYISADDKYVRLHTGKKTWLLRETLANLEKKLDPAEFARIHRSHIVRLSGIREMSPRSHGDYWVLLKNGERLVMSRRYRARLFGQ
ncbi:MAG TPA: response regulator transcription factor [Bacteroidetes bacterium]|nr:response regulator transcription factor [Bacteroidota bacterium]